MDLLAGDFILLLSTYSGIFSSSTHILKCKHLGGIFLGTEQSRRKTIYSLKVQLPSDTLAPPLTHCVTLNKMLKVSVSVKWGS